MSGRIGRGRLSLLRTGGTLLALVALLLAGCAEQGSPPGGPEDKTKPRVLDASPDSGAVGVALVDTLALLFSEPMNRRSVEEAIVLSPPIGFTARRWEKDRFSLVLAHPLEADRTYVLFLKGSAVDRRRNAIERPVAIGFSTGDSIDTGRAAGLVIGQRYAPKQRAVFVWEWEKTGIDTLRSGFPEEPIRFAETDGSGKFELSFLPRNRPLRLGVFYDAEGNDTFDRGRDRVAFWPDPIALADSSRGLTGIELYLADRDEPATVAGSVSDTLCAAKNPRRELNRIRAQRDSLRTALLGPNAPEPETRPGRSLDEPAEPIARLPFLTEAESLRVGIELLALDSLQTAAEEDSAYCLAPVRTELATPEGQVLRTADGAKFSWADVPPGLYRLSAYRDVDRDGTRDEGEPHAEFEHPLEALPLREVDVGVLSLRTPGAGSP